MYDMMMGPQALFTLFGMPVYPFALMVTLAAVCAVFMAVKRAKAIRVGQGPALLFAVLAIPLSVIFGRLIFCLCRIVDVLDFGVGYIFRIDYGGFSVIGVTAGLAIAAWLTCLIEKVRFLDLCDSVVPGLLLVLAVARFAEGSTTNGTGPEVSVAALQFFPVARQGLYGEYTYAVHMGEGLTALIASVYTQTLGLGVRGQYNARRGYATGMGVIIAAAAQIVWESARRDEVLKFDFIRYGMVFAGVMLLCVLIPSLIRCNWSVRKRVGAVAVFALLIVVCVMMEFFIDGKIIQDMPIWLCYLIDTLCACGIATICARMLRSAVRA